jgi:mannose-6-phosphate isomerase-like protein (cupin superfamily)
MPEKQNIATIAATLPQPFIHTVVGRVDNYCAYLTRILGSYKFHAHDRDEMYLVLQGEMFVEYEGGQRVQLGHQESLVVKAGEVHRSGADKEALVLMFKACDLFAE